MNEAYEGKEKKRREGDLSAVKRYCNSEGLVK